MMIFWWQVGLCLHGSVLIAGQGNPPWLPLNPWQYNTTCHFVALNVGLQDVLYCQGISGSQGGFVVSSWQLRVAVARQQDPPATVKL